jgi:hypothetical protein
VNDLRADTISNKLFLDQVILCYFKFFLERVSGNFDYFHSIQESRMDSIKGVSSSNEEDLGEIEGRTEIMVSELLVLLWV